MVPSLKYNDQRIKEYGGGKKWGKKKNAMLICALWWLFRGMGDNSYGVNLNPDEGAIDVGDEGRRGTPMEA